jgi:hypothetical protein
MLLTLGNTVKEFGSFLLSSSNSPVPPPLNERYFTQLDGQSKFFRRETVWECVDPVVEVVFLGYKPTSTYMLFDGDLTGNARAFAFINANTGFVNCPNAQTLELNGVEVNSNTGAAEPVEGELNHIRVSFTGTWKVQVLGTRFARDAVFAPTIISSIKLIDPADTANTHTTKFVNNEAYQLELDGELGPDLISSSVFGNPSISGSQWSLVGDEWQYVGDGSFNSLQFLSDAEQPELLEIAFTVTGFTGSGAGTFVNAAASGQSFSANGDYLFTVTKSVSGAQVFKRFGGVCSFNISNISIKAIPASTFLRENEEPDGSDIVDITRKPDNSGWTGDGLDYDYADGALPE